MGLFDNVVEEASVQKNTRKLALLTLENVIGKQLEDLKKAMSKYTIEVKECNKYLEGKYQKFNADLEFTLGNPSYTNRASYVTHFFDMSDGDYVSFSHESGGYIKRYYITSGATEEELTAFFEEMLVEIVGHLLGVKKIQKW